MRREFENSLVSWSNRHGMRVTDVYKDSFYYIDVVDDVGGKYEISIFRDEDSDLLKVCVWNHQKKSCGFRAALSDLERVLDQAYSRIIKWMEQSKAREYVP